MWSINIEAYYSGTFNRHISHIYQEIWCYNAAIFYVFPILWYRHISETGISWTVLLFSSNTQAEIQTLPQNTMIDHKPCPRRYRFSASTEKSRVSGTVTVIYVCRLVERGEDFSSLCVQPPLPPDVIKIKTKINNDEKVLATIKKEQKGKS